MSTVDKVEQVPLLSLRGSSEEDKKAGNCGPAQQQQDYDNGHEAANPSAGSEVGKNRWERCRGVFITVITLLSFTFLYAAISMIAPFYPIAALDYNVADYIVGFVIAIAPLCITVASPLTGYFLLHLGLKFTRLAGLLLAGGCLILFGLLSMMPTPTLFIIFSILLRMVEGAGTAMYSTASYTLLTLLYPNRKGTTVGLIQLSISVGYTVGPPLGGGLEEVGGFKLPFLAVGGCIITLMLLQMVIVQQSDLENRETQPWQLITKLFSNVMFILLVLSLVMTMSVESGILSNYARFLHGNFGLSAGYIGLVYFIGTLTYVLGSFSSGLLADMLAIPRYLIILGLVIDFVGCGFMSPPKFIATPNLWLSVTAWAFTGVGVAFAVIPVYLDISGIANTLPIMFGLVPDFIFLYLNTSRTWHEDGAVISSALSGIVIGSISAGEFIGPAVGGAIVQGGGFRLMTFIFSLVLLVCVLVLITATAILKIRDRIRIARN